jgi:hypothetical protein
MSRSRRAVGGRRKVASWARSTTPDEATSILASRPRLRQADHRWRAPDRGPAAGSLALRPAPDDDLALAPASPRPRSLSSSSATSAPFAAGSTAADCWPPEFDSLGSKHPLGSPPTRARPAPRACRSWGAGHRARCAGHGAQSCVGGKGASTGRAHHRPHRGLATRSAFASGAARRTCWSGRWRS